jgi:hypothetical protein
MKWTRTLCACVCVVLFVVGLGLAQEGGFVPPAPVSRIIYVDQCCACDDGDGSSPDRSMTTIQTAIDLARPGDRVFVMPGVYKESLNLKGKAITVKGIAGPQGVPVLKASGQAAVLAVSGEDSRTVLQNMVICESLVGVSLVDSHPTLLNLTVTRCGIGVLGLGQSEPVINSCILWGNTLEDLAGVTAYYSCIEKRLGPSRLYNMSVDPLFVDSRNHDYRLRTNYGRYESALDQWVYDEETSPCVSTGDPETTLNLEPQPHGDRVNMGAFGNTMYASTGPDPSSFVRISSFGGGYDDTGEYMAASATVESPDREIVGVEFYADGVLVARDSDSRGNWYEGQWSPEFPEETQEFELMAVAVDEYGVRSLSEPRVIPIGPRGGGHGGGGR